jgi:hypothetical protein
MSSKKRSQIIFRSWFVLLAMIVAPALVSAQKNKKSDSTPPPKNSAPPVAQRPVNHPATVPPHSTTVQPHSAATKPGSNTVPPRTTGIQPRTTTTQPPHTATNEPRTMTRPDGSRTVHTATGHSLEYGKNGRLTSLTTRSGAMAKYSPSGRITSIHTNGMTINHGFRGERTTVSERINERGEHIRTVSMGAHRGFVEHPFTRGGRSYLRRTYVVNGRVYARVYRGYPYRGVVYYRYVPAYYYGPRFYGWAYSPWGAPVVYSWGWGPWYPAYGYYFAPYAAYPDASLWLTDYVVAANLQAAYEAQADSNGPAAPAESSSADSSANENGENVTLTPEVKQAIADEVKAQLVAERDAASTSPQTTAPSATPGNEQLPDALDPNHRTFVVPTTMNEQVADGSECALTPGDVLTRIDDTPDQNQNVKVLVSSSQKNDCRSGSQFAVSVQDLQDMHNHFREQIDEGLGKLAESQGKNGLPAAPDTATAQVAEGQAQPDLTAQSDLASQQQQANQAEGDVRQAAQGGTGD